MSFLKDLQFSEKKSFGLTQNNPISVGMGNILIGSQI